MRDEGAPSCGICGRKAHGTTLFPPPERPMIGMGPSRPADFHQRVAKRYEESLNLYRGQLCQCSPPLFWVGGAYVGGHLHVPDVQTPGRVAGGSSSPASLADELRKLDALRRNGVLTDGEFQKLKRRLIGQA
jgi:hypothetical protein